MLGTITVTTDVEIDISDILCDISDEDLVEELASRKIITMRDQLVELLAMINSNQKQDAIVLLESLIAPTKDHLAAYTKWKKESRK